MIISSSTHENDTNKVRNVTLPVIYSNNPLDGYSRFLLVFQINWLDDFLDFFAFFESDPY